ncbi:MAG TPA: cytochrome C oxidase subunit IV family protein [Terracidiphilus sp.]|jgi:cytochrome c oxidase subunit 4|nr:cytochrome C oxidase subunit IV family protein [Terracidiphilus sp.]
MSNKQDPHQHLTHTGHDHDPNEQDVHDSLNHIVSPRIYIIVGATLLVFTGLTVLASLFDLGEWNPVIALFIACVKATIVVLFFMHVKYSSRLTKLTVFSGLFLFAVLIALTLSDYTTRAWGRW